ncbi:MAG: helix-turn-helix domain-containing protein [Gammaproteobacteria bacterium]|nr:helix-turn-helix domain-containing protein [Gammaproteobacteria bacterium]
MEKIYTIGQMAKTGNCKVQTIRYYEQIDLLPEPGRTQGNQRIYTQKHRDRLNFIRHCRELGFPLDKIRKILLLNDEPNHSCEEVDQIAKSHLRDVEYKIKRLQEMKKELKRMISECSCNKVSDCRIIEVLSDHSLCLTDNHQKK